MSSPLDDDDAPPLRPAAGHDVHFLERLSRADREQADVALRLYRSPEVVRAILAERGVPAGAERVALAVAPGPAPAHVVVERSGHFVTCLGAGMRVGDRPVVGFDRVAVYLARAERIEAERAGAIAVLAQKGRARALGSRLFTAGTGLTREEFRELCAVEPLVRRWVQVQVIRATARVWDRRDLVMGLHGHGAEQSSVVRKYWEEYHSLGHLLLLAAQAGRPAIAEWVSLRPPGQTDPYLLFNSVVMSAFLNGHRPLTLRALWLLARVGRDALDWAARRDISGDTVAWASAKLALAAVADSHRKLRAECAGALDAVAVPAELMTEPQAHGIVAVLHQEADRLREFPAAEASLTDRYWRPIAHGLLAGGAVQYEDLDFAAEALEGSASDLFAASFLNEPVVLADTESLLPVLCACPILGRMPAEAFYFPAAHIDRAVPYDEEATRELAGWTKPAPPVRVAPKPGRNEPCPCGSGKKFKRCCGG